MSTLIKLKRNETTASKSTSIEVLANGEPAFDGVDGALYIGDGSSTIAELNAAKKYFVCRTDGSVKTAMLDDSAVSSAKLASGAVTEGKIASNAVTSGKLASNAVTTAKITDGNVTVAKLNGATHTGNPTMDQYVDGRIVAAITGGVSINADSIEITDSSNNTVVSMQTSAPNNVKVGGFAAAYNGLTGLVEDDTLLGNINNVIIKEKSSSNSFEINAQNNSTGNWLIAKNGANTVTSIAKSNGKLTATDPIIKLGSTSGKIVTTTTNGQLTTNDTIDGTTKVTVGSDSGKFVKTTTSGKLTAVDTIDWSKITLPSSTNKVLATTTGVSYSYWAALPTVNGTKYMIGSGAATSIYAAESSGTSGQFLQSNGANAAPTFATPQIKLNNTNTNITTAFYAPTTAGTSGYILQSSGSGAPSWVNTNTITVSSASTATSATSATTATKANKLKIDSTYYTASFSGSTLVFSAS